MIFYDCPYCKITSNRKYNRKTHIERKHPASEILDNLLSASDNYNNNGYIHREPQNLDVHFRARHKFSVPFYHTSSLNNLFEVVSDQFYLLIKKIKNTILYYGKCYTIFI